MDAFFSKDDLMDMTSLLQYLRNRTSAEIVVRITNDQVIPEKTAREEFARLGMDTGEKSLSLLIYINLFQRKFVVLAGKKVVDKLGKEKIQEELDKMADRFRKYQFGFALHACISAIGTELSKTLPAE